MSELRNDRREDSVTQAVAALRRLPVPEGPSAALSSQTLAALREAANRPQVTLLQRITLMPWTTKTIAVLATAAGLLVVYVGLSSFSGKALAFADVAEVLNNVRTATWKVTTEIKMPKSGTHTTSSVGMFLAPSHERMEVTHGDAKSISIMDGQQDKIINLVPATKMAQLIELKNLPPDQENPFGKTFLGLRTLVADVLNDKAGKVERLGVATFDGQPAEGFRIERGTIETKIWADPTTKLPVRVEYRTTSGPESHTVMSDFQVNVDLDDSLFQLEVPADYTVQPTLQLDVTKHPIHYLADALMLVAELNNGVFPPVLRGEEGIDGILSDPQKLAAHFATEAGTDSPEGVRKSAADFAMTLGATFGMLGALTPEQNDWHYAGKDVRLGTHDTPIFWMRRNKASMTYHVLYADLSVKEVPADQVPKVP